MNGIIKFLETFIKTISLPIKMIIVLVVVSLIFLVMPQKLAINLSLTNFMENYRQWISFVFIFCNVLLIVNIAYFLIDKIKAFFQKRNNVKNRTQIIENIKNKLNNLDKEEKAVLREYFYYKTSSLKLQITEPSVKSLIDNHILEITDSYSQTTLYGILYRLNISEQAEKRITCEMIDLPNSNYNDEKIIENFIHNNRPPFLRKLYMYNNH
jgi:hypothetical protein